MLGRKTYTQEEVDNGKAAVARQIAAYKRLANPSDDVETVFFTNMVLVLDRYYVHRLRVVTGKDTNPINEVELIADALLNHDGVLQGSKVIKYVPEQSVLQLKVGETVTVGLADFERLTEAFFADLERKFL